MRLPHCLLLLVSSCVLVSGVSSSDEQYDDEPDCVRQDEREPATQPATPTGHEPSSGLSLDALFEALNLSVVQPSGEESPSKRRLAKSQPLPSSPSADSNRSAALVGEPKADSASPLEEARKLSNSSSNSSAHEKKAVAPRQKFLRGRRKHGEENLFQFLTLLLKADSYGYKEQVYACAYNFLRSEDFLEVERVLERGDVMSYDSFHSKITELYPRQRLELTQMSRTQLLEFACSMVSQMVVDLHDAADRDDMERDSPATRKRKMSKDGNAKIKKHKH